MTSTSRPRSLNRARRSASTNMGFLRCGRMAPNAELKRSRCPTCKIHPWRSARAISWSASATVCVMGFSKSTCTPALKELSGDGIMERGGRGNAHRLNLAEKLPIIYGRIGLQGERPPVLARASSMSATATSLASGSLRVFLGVKPARDSRLQRPPPARRRAGLFSPGARGRGGL